MRTTLADIAKEAGVSTATVDRVLNNRQGVRGRTRDRVLSIAGKLGYLDSPRINGEAAEPLDAVALDFVLPGGTNTFLHLLAAALNEQELARRDVDVRVHLIEGFNPDALAERLHALEGASRGVGLVGIDHPTVREAIRSLAVAGIPVLTLCSDISHVPRVSYVGIDNRAAGRVAGYLIGRFIRSDRGKVALFAGSLSYRGHEEREMGFRHILEEEFSGLTVVELREVRDDSERSYAEAKALLARHPDLAGIYNIGAGNRGIARALEEAGRAKDIVFIGHELTQYTRRFLLSGTMDAVIDQNPRVEAREAIDRLVRAVRGDERPFGPSVRIQTVFRENIPEA